MIIICLGSFKYTKLTLLNIFNFLKMYICMYQLIIFYSELFCAYEFIIIIIIIILT